MEADQPHITKAQRPQVTYLPCIFNQSLSFQTISLTLFHFLFGADYFSLKSGSRPSSPGPSPTPSVAGSVTSSSSSARLRRPLISPARLNIGGQKLRLFSTDREAACTPPHAPPSHFLVEPTPSIYSGCFSPDTSPFQSQNGRCCRD